MRTTRIFVVLILLGLMAGGLWLAFDLFNFSVRPADFAIKKSVYFEVVKGMPRDKVAHTLEADGIISDARKFFWLGRVTRSWGRLKAGEYELNSAMSPLEIFKVLSSGISVTFPVTVVEGDNMYQIADKLEVKKLGKKETFLRLCKDPKLISSLELGNPIPLTVEGYLYPDTYNFPRKVTSPEILRKMVSEFKTHWTTEHQETATRLGMTRHQTITLASIVEKETGAPNERPLIASVFHNRLQKRMRLESDPTTIYGIWERYDGKLHGSDMHETTAYNTYRISALPPGPISNPGLASIKAVLESVDTPYWFYLHDTSGVIHYGETNIEHSANINKYLR